jgi:hypothetical protein
MNQSGGGSSRRCTVERLPIIFGLLTFVAVVSARSRILQDPDLYLHIATGRWIVANREVPHRDVFSFSLLGSPWVAHEWLAGVISACLYDTFGWAGLLVVTALCFATAMALLLAVLAKDLEPPYALIGTFLAAGLTFPHLLARPHAFVLPLLVLWTSVLAAARKFRTAPPLYSALLIMLWANLHGSYMVGLALIPLFAVEAMLEGQNWYVALSIGRSWGIFIITSILAAFATPNLLAGILLPMRLMHMGFMTSFIGEWRSPDFQTGQPLEYWIMLVFFVSLTAGFKLPPFRVAMALLFLHSALLYQRNAELLGIITPIIFAPALGPQLPKCGNNLGIRLIDQINKPVNRLFIYVTAILILSMSGLVIRLGIQNNNQEFSPARALKFVADNHINGPVFNAINFGDYLLFSGIAPFIDGRVDMYGDTFLKRYAEVGEFPEIARQYDIQWAILNPTNPHVALLDHLYGWDRVYQDDVSIVYVKRKESMDMMLR